MQETEQRARTAGKRYYYMRFEEGYFNSYEIRYLESFENGDRYSYLLMKLYLISIKDNGFISREGRPYSMKQLAFMTGTGEELLKEALTVLEQLELIGRTDDGRLYLTDFCSHVGTIGEEALRKQEYRRRIALEKAASEQSSSGAVASESCPEMSRECPDSVPELSRECPTDIDIKQEIKQDKKQDIYLKSKSEGDKESGRRGEKKPREENEAPGFIPPTLDEVVRYSLVYANLSSSQAEQFYNYYTALGWKTYGGDSLTDWKARLRAWNLNRGGPPPLNIQPGVGASGSLPRAGNKRA